MKREQDESLEDFIPQLIIMHNRHKEITEIVKGVTMSKDAYFDNISSYSSLDKDCLSGFEFNYLEDMDEFELLTSQYLQFLDDDGEVNFMPISNLSVIEIERPFLMSDELLKVYLERN